MKCFLLSFFLVNALFVHAQSFEGKVIYKNEHKSKLPQYSDAQLDHILGDKQEYYIKGNNYKSIFNGNYIRSHLYVGKENKAYTHYAQSDTLYIEDCGKNRDSIISFEILKNQDTIMGIACDMLVIKKASGFIKKVFFNSNYYKINPELFKLHTYGNWYFTLSKIQAVSLKSIVETAEYTLIVTAQEIIPMKLDETLFTLPQNQPVKKLD